MHAGTYNEIRSHQETAAAEATAQIGSLLWWELKGSHISHADLVSKAAHENLDESYLPKAIKPATAFRRAWRHVAKQQPSGVLFREIEDDDDAIVIGVVQETRVAGVRNLDYKLLARVLFTRPNDSIIVEIASSAFDGTQLEGALLRAHQHFAWHTTVDVRTMLTSFLGRSGVSLRENGGVYFVAEQYASTLAALRRVIDSIGANRTFILPIPDSTSTRRTMAVVAQDGLGEEIRQIEAQILKFDFGKARESTLQNRLAEFDAMRARVELFAGLLSMKADGMRDRLGYLQRLVSHYANGGTSETAPSPPSAQPDGAPEQAGVDVYDDAAGF